jgi:hypothetical protein
LGRARTESSWCRSSFSKLSPASVPPKVVCPPAMNANAAARKKTDALLSHVV